MLYFYNHYTNSVEEKEGEQEDVFFEFDDENEIDEVIKSLVLFCNSNTNIDQEDAIACIEKFISDDEIDLTTFEINHWVSNRSFGELKDMYESGEIIIPELQRNFVWTSSQCSKLIESIIIGIPIPPLFLMEKQRNEYEVIDGLQRLTTISNFILGNSWCGKKQQTSKLSGKIHSSLKGKKFQDLDENYQRRITRSTVPLIEFRQSSPSNYESKYLIFERINTGSQKLSPMQVKKALFHGELIKQVYSISTNKKYNQFKNKLLSSNQLKNDDFEELILRSLVIHSLMTEKMPFKRSMDDMITEFLKKNSNICLEEYIENTLDILVRLSVNSRYEVFTNYKLDSEEFISTKRINKSIFDTLFAHVYNLVIQGDKVDIDIDYFDTWYFENVVTKFSLSDCIYKIGTNNQGNIKERIEIIRGMFNDL